MIFFVSEQYLKTYGMITDNVSVTEVSPLVEFAARAFVENILGEEFFEYLLIKYNDQTLSTDEARLVSKMQMAIAWRVTAHATLSLTYQLKNKGLQKQDGDNSTSVDLNEATFMHKHYTQEAILYE